MLAREFGGDAEQYLHGSKGPAFVERSQHFTALGDSLTPCRFVSEGRWGKRVNDRSRDAINHATGWDLSTDDVETIGERVYTLERPINVQRGVARRETDSLPYRMTHEPVPDGPSAGMYWPPTNWTGCSTTTTTCAGGTMMASPRRRGSIGSTCRLRWTRRGRITAVGSDGRCRLPGRESREQVGHRDGALATRPRADDDRHAVFGADVQHRVEQVCERPDRLRVVGVRVKHL